MWQLRTEWVPGAPLGWLPGSRLLGVFREGALHSAPRQALLSASSSTFWSLPCFTLCINLLCFLFSTKLYRSLCSDCALRLRCEISRMSEHSYWCFGGFQRGGIVPTFALWGRFWVLVCIGGPGSGGNVGGRRASVRSNYRTRARGRGVVGFPESLLILDAPYRQSVHILQRLQWD